MKYIKEYPEAKGLSGVFAVYELSENERMLARKSYLVNRKFSEFALSRFDHSELILQAIEESEYTYGIGFCDSIRECDLFYRCECLTCLLNEVKPMFEKIGRMAFDCSYKFEEDVAE